MKKYLTILIATLFGLSCSQPKAENENKGSKEDTVAKIAAKSNSLNNHKTTEPDTSNGEYPDWVDTLVTTYMKRTNNQLVRYAITHNMGEEWVLDQFEKTDTASYWEFNIGHDVSEPDGAETRYISDSWVYVDSVKRKLYEYDQQKGKLVEWKN